MLFFSSRARMNTELVQTVVFMTYLDYILLCWTTAGVVCYVRDWAICLDSKHFHRNSYHFTCQYSSIQDVCGLGRQKRRAQQEQVSCPDWYRITRLFAAVSKHEGTQVIGCLGKTPTSIFCSKNAITDNASKISSSENRAYARKLK